MCTSKKKFHSKFSQFVVNYGIAETNQNQIYWGRIKKSVILCVIDCLIDSYYKQQFESVEMENVFQVFG